MPRSGRGLTRSFRVTPGRKNGRVRNRERIHGSQKSISTARCSHSYQGTSPVHHCHGAARGRPIFLCRLSVWPNLPRRRVLRDGAADRETGTVSAPRDVRRCSSGLRETSTMGRMIGRWITLLMLTSSLALFIGAWWLTDRRFQACETYALALQHDIEKLVAHNRTLRQRLQGLPDQAESTLALPVLMRPAPKAGQ